jgi:hypothetical protein
MTRLNLQNSLMTHRPTTLYSHLTSNLNKMKLKKRKSTTKERTILNRQKKKLTSCNRSKRQQLKKARLRGSSPSLKRQKISSIVLRSRRKLKVMMLSLRRKMSMKSSTQTRRRAFRSMLPHNSLFRA